MGIKQAFALTVKQPYSYLICLGIKDIENRTWKTDYRGRIYIHSSKVPLRMINPNSIFTSMQWESMDETTRLNLMGGVTLHNSAILGYVDLVDIVTDSKSVWAIGGHYHWILQNAVLYDKPIQNVKGRLSLWNCTDLIRTHLKT